MKAFRVSYCVNSEQYACIAASRDRIKTSTSQNRQHTKRFDRSNAGGLYERHRGVTRQLVPFRRTVLAPTPSAHPLSLVTLFFAAYARVYTPPSRIIDARTHLDATLSNVSLALAADNENVAPGFTLTG